MCLVCAMLADWACKTSLLPLTAICCQDAAGDVDAICPKGTSHRNTLGARLYTLLHPADAKNEQFLEAKEAGTASATAGCCRC